MYFLDRDCLKKTEKHNTADQFCKYVYKHDKICNNAVVTVSQAGVEAQP